MTPYYEVLSGESMKSTKYGDYVIKNGKLIGDFENMYKNSTEVPWHQNITANSLATDIDLTILKHYHLKYQLKDICELGCGYGYITNRIYNSLSNISIKGFDISPTAILKAKSLFQEIDFSVVDIIKDDVTQYKQSFDFILFKGLLWFVVEDLETLVKNIKTILRPNGFIYLVSDIPDIENYYGKNIFPNASSIIDYFSLHFDLEYSSITYDQDVSKVHSHTNKSNFIKLVLKNKLN